MKKNVELYLLVDSLTENENKQIEKLLKDHPLQIYSKIFHLIIDQRINSNKELNSLLEGKVSKSQLKKYRKALYQIMIQKLEQIHKKFESKIANHDLLLEYYNVSNRLGMEEYADGLLKEIKLAAEETGAFGNMYEVLSEQFFGNFKRNYSSKHADKLLDELKEVAQEINYSNQFKEIKKEYNEIRFRSQMAIAGSEDHQRVLAILDIELFQSPEVFSNPRNIFRYYNLLSRFHFYLGNYDKSEQLIRQLIQKLLESEKKNHYTWTQLLVLITNLLVNLHVSNKLGLVNPTIQEFAGVLEKYKAEIPIDLYQEIRFELLSHRVMQCLATGKLEQGMKLVEREYTEKLFDQVTEKNKIALHSNIGQIAFCLERYDLAMHYCNKALDGIKLYWISDLTIFNRMTIILCSIEKKQFSIALSNIEALRKYIQYYKLKNSWNTKVLLMLRRVILNRGSGKQEAILKAFYEEHITNKEPDSTIDFLWVCSKVEQKNMQEICEKYL